jgi:hypothetical protein
MDWNAFTGWLSLHCANDVGPVAPPAAMLKRARTLESGWAVPICEVLANETSHLPAATFATVKVHSVNVCVP